MRKATEDKIQDAATIGRDVVRSGIFDLCGTVGVSPPNAAFILVQSSLCIMRDMCGEDLARKAIGLIATPPEDMNKPELEVIEEILLEMFAAYELKWGEAEGSA